MSVYILLLFVQCFNAVGWVMEPVKVVPKMTLCFGWDVKPYSLNLTTVRLTEHYTKKFRKLLCLKISFFVFFFFAYSVTRSIMSSGY